MNERILPFIAHLEELRMRIIRAAFVVMAVSVLTYLNTDKILRVIVQPVGKLVFLAPAEAFITYLKVAFWAALFLSSPYIIFEIWQFVGEALAPRERKHILVLLPASFGLFIFGVWFGFCFVMKAGIQFLLSFGQDLMTPMLTVSNYVSFVAAMSLSFGIVFQLPIVIALLTKVGLVTPAFLSEKRRFAIVAIFIAAGILTPSPDVFSQLCMAIPLLILYEVSIIVSRVIYNRAKRAQLQLGS